MNIVQKIDEMIEERSLLKHPFYEMWSDGKLKLESLAGYSKEYFQLVTKEERNENRLNEILSERNENAKIVSRLLEQLEI